MTDEDRTELMSILLNYEDEHRGELIEGNALFVEDNKPGVERIVQELAANDAAEMKTKLEVLF